MLVKKEDKLAAIKDLVESRKGQIALTLRSQRITEKVGGIIGAHSHHYAHTEIGIINGPLKKEEGELLEIRKIRYRDEPNHDYPETSFYRDHGIPVEKKISFDGTMEGFCVINLFRGNLEKAKQEPLYFGENELEINNPKLEIIIGSDEVEEFMKTRTYPKEAALELFSMLKENRLKEKLQQFREKDANKLMQELVPRATKLSRLYAILISVDANRIGKRKEFINNEERDYFKIKKEIESERRYIEKLLSDEDTQLIDAMRIDCRPHGFPASIIGKEYLEFVKNDLLPKIKTL